MMLPQQYHSSETPCSVSVNETSVIKVPPANSSTHHTSDAIIAGSSDDATPPTVPNTPARSPHLVSVGPRPLILGIVKIVTTRPASSSNSRPSSSSSKSSARYTPTIPQARWSSYTTPLTPHSSFATSSVSDEVASLKARLAESEAMAIDLTREKFEAASAASRLFDDLQRLQDQRVQLIEEKELLIAKLRALDEDKATPVVPPPSEGAWFDRSGKQQQIEEPQSQSASGRSTVVLDVPENQGTQRLMGKGLMKSRLGSLDEAPLIPESRVIPPETAPPNPLPSGSLRRHFLKWPRIPANPPLSASLRRQHLKWPRIPAHLLPELVSPSTSWLSGAPQVDPSQPSLVDLESQTVGIDQSAYRPSSVHLHNLEDQGAQGLNGSLDEARLIPEIRITPPESSGADSGSMANPTALVKGGNQYLSPNSCLLLHRRTRPRSRTRDNTTLVHPRCIPVMQRTLPPKAPFSTSSRRTFKTTLDQPQCVPVMQPTLPPINLAIEAELEARTKTMPSEIGGERRGFFSSLGRLGTPWRRPTSDRRFATVEQHATLESPRKRGPFGIFTHSSSLRGTTPEVAGDPQPLQKSRLRKLLKKGRCLISRIE